MTDMDALAGRLSDRLGPRGIIREPALLERYLSEQRGRYESVAPFVARPATADEVAETVFICAEARCAVIPQGGNTGLVGGAVVTRDRPGILLSLERLRHVREIDTVGDTMTVEAGCILADIQEAAREHDRLFPLSLGAEGSCQIGGNLSTNAGGTNVLRYGNARDLVLGLEVVLADGRIWHGLRKLRKDNTGYDLKQLFLGSEGTLGVITAATLRLFPLPRQRATAIAAVRDVPAALALLGLTRARAGGALTGFEYIAGPALEMVLAHVPGTRAPLAERHAHYVLIELASEDAETSLRERLENILGDAFEREFVTDAALAQSETQSEQFWRLRETIPEAQKPEGASIKHDISVPIDRIDTFIREALERAAALAPGVRPVVFGHLGDGNIHFNLSQPVGAVAADFLARWDEVNEAIDAIAVGLGGSFSAEHGVGLTKRRALDRHKSELEIELMGRLKAALDPAGLLNPGKIFD